MLYAYMKSWPETALNHDEYRKGREDFALQWDSKGQRIQRRIARILNVMYIFAGDTGMAACTGTGVPWHFSGCCGTLADFHGISRRFPSSMCADGLKTPFNAMCVNPFFTMVKCFWVYVYDQSW